MTAEENDTVKFTYDSDSGDIAMEAKYDEDLMILQEILQSIRTGWSLPLMISEMILKM